MSKIHEPVLLHEVIEQMNIVPNGWYIDGTFGRGGHAKAVLENLGEEGRLIVLDQDPEAIEVANALAAQDSRVEVIRNSFINLKIVLTERDWIGKVNGLLLDIGVSSPQLDEPTRGFSFSEDGPLDMRMDPDLPVSAASWLNSADEKEISQVLRDYGEERFHRRIARRIVQSRVEEPLTTTRQLAELVKKASPTHERHKHPATRTFQAVRIQVNQELQAISQVLPQALECLAPGGRLLVISFHSLEDRIVKDFMNKTTKGDAVLRKLPVVPKALMPKMKVIGRFKVTEAEKARNPRARSAILRVMEKKQ